MATASYRSEQFDRQTCGRSVSWRQRLCLLGSLQPFGKHSVNFVCWFVFVVNRPGSWLHPRSTSRCLWTQHKMELSCSPGRSQLSQPEKVISTIDRKKSFRANIPNLSMLEDSNARVGCSKINSHRIVLPHFDSLRKDVIIAWEITFPPFLPRYAQFVHLAHLLAELF